jgi:DNA-binding transcriptional ArsR family regulator
MDILFKALNDSTRRRILELLREKDLSAGEIADRFHISKPSISHHLDLLKQADLVLAEKDGQFVIYSLNTSVLDECLAWLLKLSRKTKTKAVHETDQKRVAPIANPGRALLRRRHAVG